MLKINELLARFETELAILTLLIKITQKYEVKESLLKDREEIQVKLLDLYKKAGGKS